MSATAGRARRAAIEIARSATMAALRPVEHALLRSSRTPAHPPCFIIGPPRSGTTLLYELLITRFRVAYISNLAHRLFDVPVAASWLGRPWIMRWQGRFESRYGHIRGMGAPNEGGWVWSRWMSGMDPMDASDASSLPVEEIRGTVAGVERSLGGPFLNKNVVFSVRMKLLDAIFPDCLFVEVQRDVRANIRSIVRAERSEGGPRDASGWWSVKPRGWRQHCHQGPAHRAAAQVRGVHDDIAVDAGGLGPSRLLSVRYEEMCEDPEAAADRVGAFLKQGGSALAERGNLPRAFRPTPARPLEEEVERELERAILEFWAEAGPPTR